MSTTKIQAPIPGCNAQFTAMVTARSQFLAAHRAWLATNPPADAIIDEADATYSAMMQYRMLGIVGDE